MKRYLLSLPVCLFGCPLLVYLILASSPTTAQPSPPAEVVVVADLPKGDKLPDNAGMEKLAKEDPVAFLENALRRYDQEVKGYNVNLHKLERINGKLQPKEVTECHFREEPFSVLMNWKEGANKAVAVLYVKGKNNDKLLIRPNYAFLRNTVVEREVNGADAKASSRYPINEFGIKIGTVRTLNGWKEMKKDDNLRVEFQGTQKVKELGDRPMWVLYRKAEKLPEDGVKELTIYVDPTNWLQVGSVLKDEKGDLIAEYWFRDVELNPTFKDNQFEKEGLKAK